MAMNLSRLTAAAGGWGRRVWGGLGGGLRPMLLKELRARTRGWRSPALQSLYLLALGGVSLGMYALMFRGTRFGSGLTAEVGIQIFSYMALFQVMIIAFVVPALTAGAISGERERRTFDLLLVTRVSPAGMVLGKLVSSILYVILLLLATLPVFALVYFFGGVPLAVLFAVLGLSAASAVAFGAVGLFFSALFKRTQAAAVATYAAVFLLVFGSLVATVVLAAVPRYPPVPYQVPPWTAYISPVYALVAVLPFSGGGVPYDAPMVPFAMPLMQGMMGMMGGGGPWAAVRFARVQWLQGAMPPGTPPPPDLMEPWVYHLAFLGVFTVALLILTMVLVAPVKPWHGLGGRVRRRLRFRRGPGAPLGGEPVGAGASVPGVDPGAAPGAGEAAAP